MVVSELQSQDTKSAKPLNQKPEEKVHPDLDSNEQLLLLFIKSDRSYIYFNNTSVQIIHLLHILFIKDILKIFDKFAFY